LKQKSLESEKKEAGGTYRGLNCNKLKKKKKKKTGRVCLKKTSGEKGWWDEVLLKKRQGRKCEYGYVRTNQCLVLAR